MPDVVGKLDGLREILHPIEPVQADNSTVLMLSVLAGLVLILVYLYRQYRQRPLVKARRLFSHLKKHCHAWDAIQCGDCLTRVLLFYEQAKWKKYENGTTHSIDTRKNLQDKCNQLRFSGVKRQPETVEQAISQMQSLLRSTS